jgi:hypothetical protein
MPPKERKPQTPKQIARDRGLINVLSGSAVVLIGLALLLFGEETQPGERRNALWLAFEQLLGWEGVCALFIAIGALLLVLGIRKLMRAKRMPDAPIDNP